MSPGACGADVVFAKAQDAFESGSMFWKESLGQEVLMFCAAAFCSIECPEIRGTSIPLQLSSPTTSL